MSLPCEHRRTLSVVSDGTIATGLLTSCSTHSRLQTLQFGSLARSRAELAAVVRCHDSTRAGRPNKSNSVELIKLPGITVTTARRGGTIHRVRRLRQCVPTSTAEGRRECGAMPVCLRAQPAIRSRALASQDATGREARPCCRRARPENQSARRLETAAFEHRRPPTQRSTPRRAHLPCCLPSRCNGLRRKDGCPADGRAAGPKDRKSHDRPHAGDCEWPPKQSLHRQQSHDDDGRNNPRSHAPPARRQRQSK